MEEPALPAARKQPIVESILNELGFGWYQARIIIVLGVAHSTDTMETVIQTILGPSLRCEWRLPPDLVALLTTLVFLGSCLGAVPMGYAADVYGRQTIGLFSCVALMYLSWLCSIAPTYAWMAALRFLSGIFIGGLLTSGSCLLTETMPASYQETGQLITYTFETLIGVITAAIGLGCLTGGLNWRYFVFLTTAPLIFCAFGLAFIIQESPVYLHCKKRPLEAAEVLDQIAIINKRMPQKALPSCEREKGSFKAKQGYTFSFKGRLVNTREEESFQLTKYGLKEILVLLFGAHVWLLPVLLIINFLWGFILYGGATILPVELAVTPRSCLQDLLNANASYFLPTFELPHNDGICCHPLKEKGYYSLLASASGGLLSFPLAYLLISWFGRRWSVTASFVSVGVLLFIQDFCLSGAVMNVVFFVTRALASAGYSLTSLYVSSAFQSRVRSLASGLGAAFFRLGILTAPYLGQVYLQQNSAMQAILLFSLSALIGSVLSVCLPKLRIRISNQSSKSKCGTNIFRNVFKRPSRLTQSEAAAMAVGEYVRPSKKPNFQSSANFSPIMRDPRISVVEKTFNELTDRRVDELKYDDFVNRNPTFEVDT